jgi:cytochrome c peroxidase
LVIKIYSLLILVLTLLFQLSCRTTQKDHRTKLSSPGDSKNSEQPVKGEKKDSYEPVSKHSVEKNAGTAETNGKYLLGQLTDGKVRMMGASPDGRFTFARRKLLNQLNGTDYEFSQEAFTLSSAELANWNTASKLYGDLYFYPQQVKNITDPSIDDMYPRSERFHLPYTGAEIPYNSTTDGVCTLMPEHCGKQTTVISATENYGTLAFDPRHGVKAISVTGWNDCMKSDYQNYIDPNGEYLCYKMILYAPFFIQVVGTNVVYKRMYQVPLSVSMRYRYQGGIVRNAGVVGARFDGNYQMSETFHPWRNGSGGISGLEVSATADGRLIVWKESTQSQMSQPSKLYNNNSFSFFSFNPTPWDPRTWETPVLFSSLGGTYGNKLICSQPKLLIDCPLEERVPLKSIYKLAAKPFVDSYGTRLDLSAKNYLCSYPWMKFDGSDVICGLGAKYATVGQGTNWQVNLLDDATNGFNVFPTHLKEQKVLGKSICATPTSQNCHKFKTLVPFFLVEAKITRNSINVGTESGLWSSFQSGKPKNFNINFRHDSLEIFLRHDSLEFYNLNLEKLTENIDEMNSYKFATINTDFVKDPSHLLYYSMQPTEYTNLDDPISQNLKQNVGHIRDSSNTGAIGYLRNMARIEKMHFNPTYDLKIKTKRQLFSSEGFIGQGAYLNNRSYIATNQSDLNLPATMPSMTMQIAARLMAVPGQQTTAISTVNNAVVIAVERRGEVKAYINAHNSSDEWTKWPSFSFGNQLSQIGDEVWHHFGLTYDHGGTVANLALYVDGALVFETLISCAQDLAPVAESDDSIVRIGPNCTRCAKTFILAVDEFALYNEVKSLAHFQRHNGIDPTVSDTDIYPYTLTGSISGEAPFIPAGLSNLVNSKEQFIEAAKIGANLFNNPILSTHTANLDNRGSSCVTCHASTKAFTDSRPGMTSVGLADTNLNSPTIVNRLLSREQGRVAQFDSLWDQVVHPIVNPIELAADFNHILTAIRADSEVSAKVLAAFELDNSELISQDHIRASLVAFVLSVRTSADLNQMTKDDSRFRSGRLIFEGKGRCISCHSGPNFTDERVRHTDGSAIKTPTLWNVGQTAPYFHTGKFATLSEVIDLYTNPIITDETDAALRKVSLTSTEKDDLIYFLTNLDGKTVAEPDQTGGSTDGGSTDGGSTDGGSTDGGSTDNGSTDNGSTDNGSTDNGSTDDGSSGFDPCAPLDSPAVLKLKAANESIQTEIDQINLEIAQINSQKANFQNLVDANAQEYADAQSAYDTESQGDHPDKKDRLREMKKLISSLKRAGSKLQRDYKKFDRTISKHQRSISSRIKKIARNNAKIVKLQR